MGEDEGEKRIPEAAASGWFSQGGLLVGRNWERMGTNGGKRKKNLEIKLEKMGEMKKSRENGNKWGEKGK